MFLLRLEVTRPTKRTANIRKLNTNKPSVKPADTSNTANDKSINQNASCSFDLLNEIEKLQDVFFNDDNSLMATNNKNDAANDTTNVTQDSSVSKKPPRASMSKEEPDSSSESSGFKLSDQELLGYLESISSIGKNGSPTSMMTPQSDHDHNNTINDEFDHFEEDDEGLQKDLDEAEYASNRMSNRKSLSYYTTQSFHSSMNTSASIVSPGREMVAACGSEQHKQHQMSMSQVKKLHSKLSETPCSPAEKLRKSMSMPRLSLVSFFSMIL